MLARVVGKHCEAGDIVVKDEFLPADVRARRPARGTRHRGVLPEHGEQLQPRARARRWSRSRDGVARVIVRRETEDDLLAWMWGSDDADRHTAGAGRAAGLRHRRHRGGPAAARAGRRPDRPDRRAAASWSASRCAGPAGTAARCRSTRRCSPPTRSGLVKRDDVDVVVEVVGGIEPARTWLVEALRAGKSVVTANKALLAEDGARAARRGRPRAAPTSTTRPRWPARSRCCARCASRCTATGSPGSSASSTAPPTSSCPRWTPPAPASPRRWTRPPRSGYAEADPTADVEGFDAAAKAAILASLAFHTRVRAADVYREGITEVTAADMASAKEMGCTIKLLCMRRARRRTRCRVRVHPAMIPRTHPLASVGDAFNAVFVEARGGRAADVLRPRAPVARRPPARCSVTSSRWPATGSPGSRAATESTYAAPADPADGRGRSPATTSASTWPTGPACWPPWPGCSPSTTCASQTVRQDGRGADATLVIVTHAAPTRRSRPPSRSCARWTSCVSMASVMRVEGE